MKLTLKLNSNTFECNIGYGVLIAAQEKLKEIRKAAYEEHLSLLAKAGATADVKDSILDLVQSQIEKQNPTDAETKQWLRTLAGKRFALAYGTRLSFNLDDASASLVMDQMTERQFLDFNDGIEALCIGEELAKIQRESANQMLRLSQLELEGHKDEVEKLTNNLKPKATLNEHDSGAGLVGIPEPAGEPGAEQPATETR